jgi:hypothetical protein
MTSSHYSCYTLQPVQAMSEFVGNPEVIIKLALSLGYAERRPSVSATIFLERVPEDGVKVNIFYTSRGIMTQITHPKRGKNELWRSGAYETLHDLANILKDPRTHTGRGYRVASNATRGCVSCGESKKKTEYSHNQWTRGVENCKCKVCVNATDINRLTNELQAVHIDDDSDVRAITADIERMALSPASSAPMTAINLARHDHLTAEYERRQFNCPDHPSPYTFFKQVPRHKPFIKCPACKATKGKRVPRLHPVPMNEEKGYGFFKCKHCSRKWGSSRACGNCGQFCDTPGCPGIELLSHAQWRQKLSTM